MKVILGHEECEKRGRGVARKTPVFGLLKRNRSQLFQRVFDTYNSRQDTVKFDNSPKSERIGTWKKSRKWHRMFLEFCEKEG